MIDCAVDMTHIANGIEKCGETNKTTADSHYNIKNRIRSMQK